MFWGEWSGNSPSSSVREALTASLSLAMVSRPITEANEMSFISAN